MMIHLFERNSLIRYVYMLINPSCPYIGMPQDGLNIPSVYSQILQCSSVGVAQSMQGDATKTMLGTDSLERSGQVVGVNRSATTSCEDQFVDVAKLAAGVSKFVPAFSGSLTAKLTATAPKIHVR